MKRTLIAIAILAACWTALPDSASAAPAPNPGSLHFGYFYRSLRPHGEWIVINDGVYAWRPNRGRSDWRPYLLGRWAWTDYGWYWISREPFGYITYHYGRWYFDDFYGWLWVPDDEWGPSWVEFRASEDCVGWAPLPPYAGFHVSFGIRFTREWVASPNYWNVVRVGYFGNEVRYRDVQSPEYVTRFIGNTRVERNYGSANDHVMNRGIDPGFFERRGNRRVERFDVRMQGDRPGEVVFRGDSQRPTHIEVFRPRDDTPWEAGAGVDARRSDRRSSLDVDRIGTGRTGPQPQPSPSPLDRGTRRIATPAGSAPANEVQSGDRRQRTLSPESQPAERRADRRKQQEIRQQTLKRYERQAPAPPIRHEAPRGREERSQQRSENSRGRSSDRRHE